MKHICPYTLLQWESSGFTRLHKVVQPLPIFSLPFNSLQVLYKQWECRQLDQTESALLALAALNCTGKLQFKSAVDIESISPVLITTCLPDLFESLAFLFDSSTRHQSYSIPQFCISDTAENTDLSCLKIWCDLIKDAIDYYYADRRVANKLQQIRDSEEIIDKYLRNPEKYPASRYISHLADWIADAAEFPVTRFQIGEHPARYTTIRAYWIQIICASASSSLYDVLALQACDILEIQDHIFAAGLIDLFYDSDESKPIRSGTYADSMYSKYALTIKRLLSQAYDTLTGKSLGLEEVETTRHYFRPISFTLTELTEGVKQSGQSSSHMQTEQSLQHKQSDYPTLTAYCIALAQWKKSIKSQETI